MGVKRTWVACWQGGSSDGAAQNVWQRAVVPLGTRHRSARPRLPPGLISMQDGHTPSDAGSPCACGLCCRLANPGTHNFSGDLSGAFEMSCQYVELFLAVPVYTTLLGVKIP